jgi:hypothetical protein
VTLMNEPGTVYFGQLTGPRHQVIHCHAADHELVDATTMGLTSVSVMFRTGLFPYFRSRLRDILPVTPALFRALASSFLQVLGKHEFKMPPLMDCVQALALLEVTSIPLDVFEAPIAATEPAVLSPPAPARSGAKKKREGRAPKTSCASARLTVSLKNAVRRLRVGRRVRGKRQRVVDMDAGSVACIY